MVQKPKWVVKKEQAQRMAEAETIWLFGIHAVRDALANPDREKLRLIVTRNAADKLREEIAACGIEPEMADARKFPPVIDPGSVHQGAVLEVKGLRWGGLDELCVGVVGKRPIVVLLDRVTDPHNVGAVMRSAEVFGALAVIAPSRASVPETGALAKTASGALERQPYIRVKNLSDAMRHLQKMGYILFGLDGDADVSLEQGLADHASDLPIGLVLGAEGPGMRDKTKETCDHLVRIDAASEFGSLNVSNAAAVGLFAVSRA